MKKALWSGLIAALAWAAPAWSAPAQVIVIRHGEKPAEGNDLDSRGFARADALVDFFEHNPAVTKFGPPAAIYAMKPSGSNGSVRPIHTVAPLAKDLGLVIDADYLKDQLPQLVANILGNASYDGKTVLICWEHNAIPTLVEDFGWTSAPRSWSGKVFDRAWVLTFDGNAVVSFEDVPEHVLPGDSAD